MKPSIHPIACPRAFLLPCIPILCIVILACLLSARPLTALADGGGLPTSTDTPSPTSTPTEAPTATEALLLFPVTPTFTVLPIFNNPNPGSPILGLQAAATPTPAPRSGFNVLSCWPFAIVALAILIAGILWLRSRVTQPVP